MGILNFHLILTWCRVQVVYQHRTITGCQAAYNCCHKQETGCVVTRVSAQNTCDDIASLLLVTTIASCLAPCIGHVLIHHLYTTPTGTIIAAPGT